MYVIPFLTVQKSIQYAVALGVVIETPRDSCARGVVEVDRETCRRDARYDVVVARGHALGRDDYRWAWAAEGIRERHHRVGRGVGGQVLTRLKEISHVNCNTQRLDRWRHCGEVREQLGLEAESSGVDITCVERAIGSPWIIGIIGVYVELCITKCP